MDNQKTTPFSRILLKIKDELEDKNPTFVKVIDEALSKDGTLAMKVHFGQLTELTFKPDKPNKKEKEDK